MIYYYFTLAFVLLASWAICGIASVYSPDLLIKSSFTVKNDTLRRLLKIETEEARLSEDDPDRYKVTKIGAVMRFLWLAFLIMSLIILFVADPTPITKEHETALVMPVALTTFNQKVAHYINLIFLCIASSAYIINSFRLLAKEQEGVSPKSLLTERIIWCSVAALIFAAGLYIAVKCIQLLSFM